MLLSEGLGSHTRFLRAFFDGCVYCPTGAQTLKVAHKKKKKRKQKKQGYLPAKSITKFASSWARKLISLHTYERKMGEKLKARGRIWGCGVELGRVVRSGGCWSEFSTIREPSVSTTSHLVQAGFFVDSIYLSYFLHALKLYRCYLVGICEQRSV